MPIANGNRSFEPLDDLRYARIGSARLSPDGQLAVCDVTKHDLENDRSSTSLWSIDLASGLTRQLTQDNNNSSPSWSPDGTLIAFLSDRCEKKQVFLLPIDGGEARQLTDLTQGVDGPPVWSPDGESIAFTASANIEKRDPMAPYRVTRTIYRFDGVGYLDDAVQNIYLQSVRGGDAKQLTNDAHMDRTLRWSPDGREILYLASFDPDRSDLFSAKLRRVSLDGDVDEILGLDWGFIKECWMDAGWQKRHGCRFKWRSADGDQDDLWIVNRDGGQAVNRTRDLPTGVEVQWFPVFSAANILTAESTALVGVVNRGSRGIYSVALYGEPHWQPLLGGNRTIALQDADAEKMIFLSGDLENPRRTAHCVVGWHRRAHGFAIQRWADW